MAEETLREVRILDRLSVCVATGFYLSTLPTRFIDRFKTHKAGTALLEKKLTGAGLVGSIEGALTYLLLPASVATAWWALMLGGVIAVTVSNRAERVLDSHDDSRIVIDEWIGAWLALAGLRQSITPIFIGAFVLFRFFDVMKGPIGRALQHLPGGWGVTLDDVYAGVMANLLWRVIVGAFAIAL